MAKSEKLLQLLQLLREHHFPVKGQVLAEKLEISLRTLYRYIEALKLQGAEIDGEAGVGYQLKPGFTLPPLMFTYEELEALELGIQCVLAYGDSQMQQSANQALSKIKSVAQKLEHASYKDFGMVVGPSSSHHTKNDLSILIRRAIKTSSKVNMEYLSSKYQLSQRVVWPIGLIHMQQKCLIAWCEKRESFRHFRIDRIQQFEILQENYKTPRFQLLKAWRKQNNLS